MNERPKNLAAILLVTCALVAAIGSCARGVVAPVRDFAPIPQATAQIALSRAQQEAEVTATYINALAAEVVADTTNDHELARLENRGDFERRENLAWAVNFVGIGLVGVIGLAFAFIIARYAIRAVPPPTRWLKDGSHLLPSGHVTDTRSGTTWLATSENPALPAHASSVQRYRGVQVEAVTAAILNVMHSNGTERRLLLERGSQ